MRRHAQDIDIPADVFLSHPSSMSEKMRVVRLATRLCIRIHSSYYSRTYMYSFHSLFETRKAFNHFNRKCCTRRKRVRAFLKMRGETKKVLEHSLLFFDKYESVSLPAESTKNIIEGES